MLKDREQLERWCEDRALTYRSFQMAEQGGVGGTPKSGGETRWEVSGWLWPRDPAQDKTRIFTIAPTFEEAVETVQARWKELRDGETKAGDATSR